MAGLPNPFSREGFLVGSFALSSQIPRPSLQPRRSLQSALSTGGESRGTPSGSSASPVKTGGMASALRDYLKHPRMELHDLSRLTDDPSADLPNYLEAHFNPAELKESIRVNWKDIVIPGQSHARLHYSHTENDTFKYDLQFDALSVADGKLRGTAGITGIEFARRFLQSLCYPRGGAQSVKQGAPPRVLFFWPKLLSLVCVVAEQEWTYQQFASDGSPLRFRCSMTLREVRDIRLTSDQVLRGGSNRNTAKPTSETIEVE